jgi:site-specific DNA recombinase
VLQAIDSTSGQINAEGHFRRKGEFFRSLLVEKTDRLYRNIRDYATIDEFSVEVHFVKENEIISPSSRSSEQFVHGIKVLMARNLA